MKSNERERLLREILLGDEVSGFRQGSMEFGLNALKARRKHHRLCQAGALAVFLLVLAAGLLWQLIHFPVPRRGFAPAQLASGPLPSKAGAVKFISDDELLALFPDRAVALIGKPGHQQLLFLGEESGAVNYE